jgi:TetR/AcrR family transcriptional regulator, repressor of fatR-cypB operon
MATYKERTDTKKAAIVSAALTLFKQKGFTSTGIKDIADAAHVSQVSIYNYFGSKDALILECFSHILDESFIAAQQILQEDIPFPDKLNRAIALTFDQAHERLGEYFSRETIDDHRFFSMLNEQIFELQRKIYRAYLIEGQRTGFIRTDVPFELILNFVCTFNMVTIDTGDYMHQLDSLYRLYLNGVRKE